MIHIEKLELDPAKRVIITSDIHASLALFKRLLDKVNFTNDDYLLINGDICEKGPNSLETVAYIRELQMNNSNIYITKGNCDVVHRYVWDENERIIPYIQNRKTILKEMLEIKGKNLEDFPSLKELSAYYKEHYSDELDWLESLPIAYETEDFILVHAGIGDKEDWRETEEETALYIDAFYGKHHHAPKPVIVGHWPVINYRETEICTNNPLIDLEKNIIAIDGGNQLKKEGQLNALLYHQKAFSYTYVDDLTEQITIKKDYEEKLNRIGTVTYPNYELRILQEEKYFTLCENIQVQTKQWVKNEYINKENNRCKTDVSTTFLSVSAGEVVSIIDQDCQGYLLVKNESGEVGWISRDLV